MSKPLTQDQAIAQLAGTIDRGEREDRAQQRAERLVQDRKGDGAPSGRASNGDTIDLDDAISRVAGQLEREDKAVADELGDDEPDDDDIEAQADDSDDADDVESDDDADDVESDDDAKDDDSDDDVDDGGDPWKATRTVTIDGQEYEVTPEEALVSYQKHQAHTRRFMEAAELRKEATAKIETYVAAMNVIEQAFPGMAQQIQQMRQPAQAALQEGQEATVRAAIGEAMQTWHDSGSRFDDASRTQAEDAVVGYMQSQGLTENDIRGVATSALAMTLVEKAMKYDQATGGKAPRKAKNKASPNLLPGSKPPSSKAQQARRGRKNLAKRFKATGSMEDAVNLVASMIDI